jgi:hypothetical protein
VAHADDRHDGDDHRDAHQSIQLGPCPFYLWTAWMKAR